MRLKKSLNNIPPLSTTERESSKQRERQGGDAVYGSFLQICGSSYYIFDIPSPGIICFPLVIIIAKKHSLSRT